MIIVFTRTAEAQDWYLSPKIEATGEYNDNYFFTSQHKVSDYFSHIKPTVEIARDTEDTLLHFASTLDAEIHLRRPDLDTIGDDSQLALTHNWSQRLSSNFTGTFSHNETLNQELLTAGLVTQRVERYVYGSGLSSDYALSETTTFNAGADVTETQYPSGFYPNLLVWDTHLSPGWQINPYNTVGFLASYCIADYGNIAAGKGKSSSLTNRTLSTSLTWRHTLNDTTFFTSSGGLSTAWVESNEPGFKQQPATESPIFSFVISKDWTERFAASFSAGREQYNAVNSESVTHTYIRANPSYKLSELTTCAVDLSYDWNTQNGGATNTNYFRIAPTLTRRITERLSLLFGASYENEQQDKLAGLARMRAWVSLTYDWPRALANH